MEDERQNSKKLKKICAKLEKMRKSGKINDAVIARAVVDRHAKDQGIFFSFGGEKTESCRNFFPFLAWHAASLYQYVFSGAPPVITENSAERIGYEVKTEGTFMSASVGVLFILGAFRDIADNGPRSELHPGAIDMDAIADSLLPIIRQQAQVTNAPEHRIQPE